MLATFCHIDIPGIIVLTIKVNACKASYTFYHMAIYTWNNKSVLLSYCSHAYNHIAILIQNVIQKVNKLVFKTKILNLKRSKDS